MKILLDIKLVLGEDRIVVIGFLSNRALTTFDYVPPHIVMKIDEPQIILSQLKGHCVTV